MGKRVDAVDQNWHHFVVTFDDDILLFYMDGQLVTYSSSTVTYPKVWEDYFVGHKKQ